MKTATNDWDEAQTKATPASKAAPLTGEAAREDQINKMVGEDLKRRASDVADAGGDVNAPKFPDEPEALPADLDASIKLLKQRTLEFEGITDNHAHRRERAIAWNKLERLRKHVFGLQQIATPPNVNVNDVLHADRINQRGASAGRAAYLDKLTEAEKHIGPDTFVNPELANVPLALSASDALLQRPVIRESLAMLTTRAILIRKSETELFATLHPAERVAELKTALNEASGGGETAELQSELMRMRAAQALRPEEVEDFAALARRPISEAKSDFARSFEIHRQHSLAALRELLEAARIAETIFFSGFALPHQETALSKKYTTAIALIESIQPTVEGLRHFSLAAAALVAK